MLGDAERRPRSPGPAGPVALGLRAGHLGRRGVLTPRRFVGHSPAAGPAGWAPVTVEPGLSPGPSAPGPRTSPRREARAVPVLPLPTACPPPGWPVRGHHPTVLVAAADGAALAGDHGNHPTGPRRPLLSARGRGWEGPGSLPLTVALCHPTQLMGMAIGALTALALVGVAVFFAYRRINQFRECVASDRALWGRARGRCGPPALCFDLWGAALRLAAASVGHCWPVQARAKPVDPRGRGAAPTRPGPSATALGHCRVPSPAPCDRAGGG